jgi:outer membrane receptor protein involved in Fe transport
MLGIVAAAAASCVWAAALAQQATTPKKGIEEIVVTAERHVSTVQKTPISITAISGAQLQARGLTSVEDVIKELPGVSVRSAGPGQTEYEARGLSSTGGAAPTVGFYLNDVPMSPPAAAQTGKIVIDPDLYDIQSVEVLRGPQGTLFGSGSMGGTIRVLTAQPNFNGYSGSIEATSSGTAGGNRPNAGLNAALNIPVTDKFALRIVGTESERSGWIDRIVVDDIPTTPLAPGSAILVRNNIQDAPVKAVAHDVNTEDLQGFRISALWKPTDDTTIKGMFLYQDLSMGGYDEFDQPPGASQQHPRTLLRRNKSAVAHGGSRPRIRHPEQRYRLLEAQRDADAGRQRKRLHAGLYAAAQPALHGTRHHAAVQRGNPPRLAGKQRAFQMGGRRVLRRSAFALGRV